MKYYVEILELKKDEDRVEYFWDLKSVFGDEYDAFQEMELLRAKGYEVRVVNENGAEMYL